MSIPIKIPAKVIKIKKHTDTLCSYILKPERRCLNFKPGQFLHLAIAPYDPSFQWPESRVFSIANSPTRSETIKITFIVKGKYTKRMYKEIRENDIVWLKLPYGDFTFSNSIDEATILIAGGTGITPFISFLEYSIDKRIDRRIFLYYGVWVKRLLLFSDIFSECENKLNNFSKVIYIENLESYAGNNYRKGILNISQIYKEVKKENNPQFYLSGPFRMIYSFKSYLLSRKILESNIHFDEWE